MSDTLPNEISVRIPQPSVPFVDASGVLSRSWLYYMIGILNRTGGNQGISAAILQKQINALFAEEAMADVQSPAPAITLSIDDVMGDLPQPAPVASAVTLAVALTDDVPKASINPFLASLLVADVS